MNTDCRYIHGHCLVPLGSQRPPRASGSPIPRESRRNPSASQRPAPQSCRLTRTDRWHSGQGVWEWPWAVGQVPPLAAGRSWVQVRMRDRGPSSPAGPRPGEAQVARQVRLPHCSGWGRGRLPALGEPGGCEGSRMGAGPRRVGSAAPRDPNGQARAQLGSLLWEATGCVT